MAVPTWKCRRLTVMSELIVDFGLITSLVVNLLVLGSVWPVMPFFVLSFFFSYCSAVLIGCHHLHFWCFEIVITAANNV